MRNFTEGIDPSEDGFDLDFNDKYSVFFEWEISIDDFDILFRNLLDGTFFV